MVIIMESNNVTTVSMYDLSMAFNINKQLPPYTKYIINELMLVDNYNLPA